MYGKSSYDDLEVLVWDGRFRYLSSRKLAILPDLTPRIHPEHHTQSTVAEFEDYVRYTLTHADTICTVSESSRNDIIDRLPVFPSSVVVISQPMNPIYEQPSFDPEILRHHGLSHPYLLCVSTVEPRKNQRRLIQAFELLARNSDARDHVLVLAGPKGWDDGFDRLVANSPVSAKIRKLGFMPDAHLPSLYHHATAVVYPSVYEGFGLPVLEAMCCSAIVAASRTSSIPEVAGDTGFDFDLYHPEDMASAIREVFRLTSEQSCEARRRSRSRADLLLARASKASPLPGLE